VLDARKKLRTRTSELEQVTAKAEELLQRALAAEALAANPPRQVLPTYNDPLPDVMNPQQLETATKQWKRAKRWAEDHPEGAEKGDKGPDGEVLTDEISPEQVRAFKRTAEDILEEAVPAKQQWIQKAAPAALEAQRVYPQLFQNTEDGNVAAGILQRIPELRRDPEFMLAIGDYVAGRKARLSKNGNGKAESVNGKPLSKAAKTILDAPKIKPAPVANKTRSVEPLERGSRVSVETKKEAKTELLNTGLSDKDLRDFIARRLSGTQGKGGRAAVLA
jgi:hypothetical protein